jgi:hypothetical protein
MKPPNLVALVLSMGLATPAAATTPVVPTLDAKALVGTWEGLAYDKDPELDQFHLIRLAIVSGGTGALTVAQGFEDATAGTKVVNFKVKSSSVKKGIVIAAGTSDDDILRSFRMQGRGKGVPGHGRLDVRILVRDPRGHVEREVSAILVQDDGVPWFSRIETGIRRFRTEK